MHQGIRQWMLISGLGLCLAQPAAAKFYTIIGPDGFPMVIYDQQQQSRESKNAQRDVQVKTPTPTQNEAKIKQEELDRQRLEHNSQHPAAAQTQQSETQYPQSFEASKKLEVQPRPRLAIEQQQHTQSEQKQQAKQDQSTQVQAKQDQKEQAAKTAVQQNNQAQPQTQPSIQSKAQVQQAVRLPATDPTQRVNVDALFPRTAEKNKIGIQDQTPKTEVQDQLKTQDPHQTVIDGVEYVSEEYLENREFNLEGKKRFYVMPDFGDANAHRMQTVERERGITASILGKSSRNNQSAKIVLALSPDYFRIDQKDVIEALEQQCFQGEKIIKAKTLSKEHKELGFWPVAPLQERFVFEVAKLAPEVDTLNLQSFANRSKGEKFYWPMVVFLDQNGCVLEGVSGFKTESLAATAFRHASIQGLLKKPKNAVYLFMTPLASAIDVDSTQLSHQGQIQLRVVE